MEKRSLLLKNCHALRVKRCSNTYVCKDKKLLLSPFFLFPFFPFFFFFEIFFSFPAFRKKEDIKKIQSTLFLCVVGRSSVVVRVSLSLSVSNARALFALCSFSFSLSRSTEERRGKGEKREFHGKTFFFSFWDFPSNFLPVSQSHRKKCGVKEYGRRHADFGQHPKS